MNMVYMGMHWFRRGCGNWISEPKSPSLRKKGPLKINAKTNNNFALAA